MKLYCVRVLFFALLSTLLAGCSVLDQYSGRAIDYNIEAEDADNQALMLNIVRASMHRPMQFTDVQNIVGSTTASGGLGLGFPIGPHPSTSITTGTATGTLTGGTTFTIPVLNTQEFYQGILTPIQPQVIDYLLKGPNSRRLIFNLLFERITVRVAGSACLRSHLASCERDFRNQPNNDVDIALFQTFANYLLSLGFSTEALDAPKKKPVETKGVVVNVQGGSADTGDKPASPHYRICFSNRTASANLKQENECGALKPPVGADDNVRRIDNIRFSTDLEKDMEAAIGATDDRDRPEVHQAARTYYESIPKFSGQNVSLLLQPRSTYDIFRYLGDMVAREGAEKQITLDGSNLKYSLTPCWVDTKVRACRPIILVDRPGVPVGSLAYVAYAGGSYSIPGDPRASFGPDVLAVLKELIALNVSAKSLPTTAILSLAQ